MLICSALTYNTDSKTMIMLKRIMIHNNLKKCITKCAKNVLGTPCRQIKIVLLLIFVVVATIFLLLLVT